MNTENLLTRSIHQPWHFPGGPVAKPLHSQCRQGPGLISGQETRSHELELKNPACLNDDQRSRMLQLRPSEAE